MNPVDGNRYFVKPLEEEERFGDFLDFVQEQEREERSDTSIHEVKYAQTRMFF